MTLREFAYTSIKEKILTCEFKPGQILNEDALCNTLNISRTPVREAISRLSQENLIEIIPKKALRVSGIKLSDLNGIYETRLFMEPQLILTYGRFADKDKLLQFMKSISDVEIKTTSPVEYTKMDMEFHQFIFMLGQSTYFKKFYDVISSQDFRISLVGGIAPVERRESSRIEHLAIIEHMLNDEYEEASELMRQHIIKARQSKYDLLSKSASFSAYFDI